MINVTLCQMCLSLDWVKWFLSFDGDSVQIPPPGLTMVLTAAFEFDPRSNKEATIRPTDNIEVPQVKKKNVSQLYSDANTAGAFRCPNGSSLGTFRAVQL